MIELNKRDLNLLKSVMVIEATRMEKEMKDFEDIPDQVMKRFYTVGRLRVWANEKLEVIG